LVKASFKSLSQDWHGDGQEAITFSSPTREKSFFVTRGVDAAKKPYVM
jgi:hypothetical protein